MRQHRGEPARALVQPGDRVYRGQMLGAPGASPSAAVHAPSAGIVRAIEERWIPGGSQLHRSGCLVIDVDHDADPGPPATHWPQDRAAAIEDLRAAGIVGLGGASFPTADKLGMPAAPRALLLNGAECEPYISCDDALMREAPDEILQGAIILADLTEAPLVLIGIERDKPAALEAMRGAAERLGDERIRIVGLPSIYPAGGERQLATLLTGIEIPSGRYPSEVGYPCHNVGTAFAVGRWVQQRQPLTHRIVTITGAGVSDPRNVEAPIGSVIADLVEFCGGYKLPVERLILGGSMMGYAVPTDELPITKSTNCVIAAQAGDLPQDLREWPCIRCGECAAACPARLMPQELWSADRDRLESLSLDACIECGCCDGVCPSHLPLTRTFRQAKLELHRQRQHAQLSRDAERRAAEKSRRSSALAADDLQAQQRLKQQADSDAVQAAVARAKNRRTRAEPDR
jgi:electron transport complex protein RnfC